MNTSTRRPCATGVPKRTREGIPAYTANGLRLRNYSLRAIEACLAMTPPAVVVKRNKRTGLITSAQFMPLPRNSSAVDGKEPIKKHAHMGQRYSFHQPVDTNGHRAWRFSKFLTPLDMQLDPGVTSEDIERWLQKIFRAVPLSCLPIESTGRTGPPISLGATSPHELASHPRSTAETSALHP
jgi:hypothetical protein